MPRRSNISIKLDGSPLACVVYKTCLDKFSRNNVYFIMALWKNLVDSLFIWIESLNCWKFYYLRTQEKDQSRPPKRELFHANILFHRSLATWISKFFSFFFIKDHKGVTLFYASPYRERRKKPIRRDAVWAKGDSKGRGGGGSFRRAEMLNYPIACERMWGAWGVVRQ